jgi:hypothetical protein
MELQAFLRLAETVLAGTIAWYLIDHIRWFAGLQPDTKRLVSYVFSAAIAILAYLGLIALGAEPVPGGASAWVSALWLVGTSSFGMSTLLNTSALKKYRTQ